MSQCGKEGYGKEAQFCCESEREATVLRDREGSLLVGKCHDRTFDIGHYHDIHIIIFHTTERSNDKAYAHSLTDSSVRHFNSHSISEWLYL